MSSRTKTFVTLGAIVAALFLFGAWIWHGTPARYSEADLSGKWPAMAEADAEVIPSVAVAKPVGWAQGEAPTGAKGLVVTRFAEGLDHPRTMLVLPNGDVIVAETNGPADAYGSGITGWIARLLMTRAGATTPSANTLVLLRDSTGDGKADQRFVLRKDDGLVSPSGLAWRDGKLYVANHDAVLQFDYQLGETKLAGTPKKLMDLPPGGGHWMRNLLLSLDGKNLFVAVGSATNIGEDGEDKEKGRAAIWELDLASGQARQYAGGMRNPNGMAWEPATGELWTVVNERDMLGPDLVPDYLTNVPIGAQYGWPWIYWKTHDDDRVHWPIPEYIDDYVRKPEYGLGSHVAPLGMAFVTGGEKLGPEFSDGAVIANHGSWNRHPLSGYNVVFVKFDKNGNPLGKPVTLLDGFLTGKGTTHGRPTWVAFAKDGALLVTDDTAGIVWRVINPAAAPAAAIAPVVTDHMKPVTTLKGPPTPADMVASFKAGPNKIQAEAGGVQ